jgi:predicted O-methyltransferase YrrM
MFRFREARSPEANRPAFRLASRPVPDLPELLRAIQPYDPLFDAGADEGHALIRGWPVVGDLVSTEPRGFLRQADALTLHDLARYQPGPVLELGSAWGLSTTILCRGVRARGSGHVVSCEIDPVFQKAVAAALRRSGLARWHRMRGGDAGLLMERAVARGETYGTVFIDHDHGPAASRAACRLLPQLLAPEGLALFHDFNDPLNQSGEYGVYDAVRAMLEANPALTLYGMPGCCALVGWAR